MEGGKRAAAVASMCMLLLLLTLAKPSHQQLSDAVCECYRQCYSGCKDITWPWVCKVECAGANGDDKVSSCMIACSMDPVCGLSTAAIDPADVVACNNECKKRWGGHVYAN